MKHYLKELTQTMVVNPQIEELRGKVSLDREQLAEGLFSCLYHLSVLNEKKITGFEEVAYKKTNLKLESALAGGLAGGIIESNAVFFIIDYISLSEEDSIDFNLEDLSDDHTHMDNIYNYFGVPREFSDKFVDTFNQIEKGSTDYSPILNFMGEQTGKQLEHSLFLFGRQFGSDMGDALEEQVSQQADNN